MGATASRYERGNHIGIIGDSERNLRTPRMPAIDDRRTSCHSISAEKACLGAAILDNTLMRGPLSCLAVSDFVLSAHQELFALMLESDENRLPFDILTLVESLTRQNKLEAIGDVTYLDSLTDGVVTHLGLIERHVQTVICFSRLRQLQKIAERAGRDASEPGADPECVLRGLELSLERMRVGCDLDGNLTPIALPKLSRHADLLTLAQVTARDVEWLWEPYIASGMLAMLSGDPAAGKTFIALAIAAAVTVGQVPCTGEPCLPGHVLYLSVENSPEHVLRPRFDSLGGDPNRFHLMRGSVTGEGERAKQGSVWLSDVGLLNDALQQTKAALVIVDPIQSYLGAEVDAHRSNETRPVMDGLSRLADEHHTSILLIRHLSKAQTGRAIHRGLGSIDLTGAVRTELLAGCAPDDPNLRALVQVKSNLGPYGPSLGYAIEAGGAFRWTGASQLTASAILAPEMTPGEPGALAEAEDFLVEVLSQGARLATDVQAEAVRVGIRERTLKRAKKKLGVQSLKSGMETPWEWSLPKGGQE